MRGEEGIRRKGLEVQQMIRNPLIKPQRYHDAAGVQGESGGNGHVAAAAAAAAASGTKPHD